MTNRVDVTKTFLPPLEEYEKYLESIWHSGQLTNQGVLLRRLEQEVEEYLGVDNFHFVSNGTIALQLALRALGITEGEVITTPFSYVATTSAILWQGCTPVYADINPQTLCIDPDKIEQLITKNTKAIMPVHVFGNSCDVSRIEHIARKHKLKIIYDAAHGFGVRYNGKSLMEYGDVSVCSFHATKVFHTIEGGGIITATKGLSDKIELIKRFGHHGDSHEILGINAKASEFQAAMGLCNLRYFDRIVANRRGVSELYDTLLDKCIERPTYVEGIHRNYAYYAIILKNQQQRADVVASLNAENIFPRRYFYPSLNTLPYLKASQSCPVSEAIAEKILCLPLYGDLSSEVVRKICSIVNKITTK